MLLFIYVWHWEVVFNHSTLLALWIGIKTTVLVSMLGLSLGVAFGLATATARVFRIPVLSQIVYGYVDFFRTTPVLVQLIWIFYVLPVMAGINLSAFVAGVITLGLNAGAFLSEIFRAGLLSINQGQRDAAKVLGLSQLQALWYVLIPQAVRRVLPAAVNVFISLVKDSSLVSIIAVSDLTYQAESAVAQTYRPFELYTALAVVYFLLTYPLSLAASAVERRFRVT